MITDKTIREAVENVHKKNAAESYQKTQYFKNFLMFCLGMAVGSAIGSIITFWIILNN